MGVVVLFFFCQGNLMIRLEGLINLITPNHLLQIRVLFSSEWVQSLQLLYKVCMLMRGG